MPDPYQRQHVYIQVIKQGSITKAADILGLSKSSVSRILAQTEQDWKATLLIRSTRSILVTEAGQAVYDHYLTVIQDVAEAEKRVQSTIDSLSGQIRITSAEAFACLFLAPIIKDFSALYPKIEIDITISSDYELLIDKGFDIAFRVGNLEDSSLKAKKLCQTTLALFASPLYLEQTPEITSLPDLDHHNCLIYKGMPSHNHWLRALGEKDKTIATGNISSNSEMFLIDMARQSQGLLLFPKFLLQPYLKKNELKQVLTPYSSPISIHAVYPHSDYKLTKKKRLFLDFVAERIERQDIA